MKSKSMDLRINHGTAGRKRVVVLRIVAEFPGKRKPVTIEQALSPSQASLIASALVHHAIEANGK